MQKAKSSKAKKPTPTVSIRLPNGEERVVTVAGLGGFIVATYDWSTAPSNIGLSMAETTNDYKEVGKVFLKQLKKGLYYRQTEASNTTGPNRSPASQPTLKGNEMQHVTNTQNKLKPIEGFPDYAINRKGEVWSKKSGEWKLIAQFKDKLGANKVSMRVGGKYKQRTVSVLLKKTFGVTASGPITNHASKRPPTVHTK